VIDFPEIERLQVADVGPDDILILNLKERINNDRAKAMRDHLREFFPTQKILCLIGAEVLIIRDDAP
jgi:hypothetical protein